MRKKNFYQPEDLFNAILFREWTRAKKILKSGRVDVNARDNIGNAVIHHVVDTQNVEMLEYLLEQGADITAKDEAGWTAFHWAVNGGNLQLVQYLHEEHHIDINATTGAGGNALHIAASCGNLEMVKYLVELGVDITVKENSGISVLHYAVASGKLELVTYLIDEHHFDVKEKSNEGVTTLHCAAKFGVFEMVKYLVDLGVDITACDASGRTVLHEAAMSLRKDLVRYLVEEHQLDVNARTADGETPLHIAVLEVEDVESDCDVIKYLLEHGADPNIKLMTGETLLNLAIVFGNKTLVQLLVRHGADVNAKDDNGLAPLYVVQLRLEETEAELTKVLKVNKDKGIKEMIFLMGKVALCDEMAACLVRNGAVANDDEKQ